MAARSDELPQRCIDPAPSCPNTRPGARAAKPNGACPLAPCTYARRVRALTIRRRADGSVRPPNYSCLLYTSDAADDM
eukprot:3700716-Prymnesium_polylepis.1